MAAHKRDARYCMSAERADAVLVHDEAVKCELFARAESLLVADCALLALIVDVHQALVHLPLVFVQRPATRVLSAATNELADNILKRTLAQIQAEDCMLNRPLAQKSSIRAQ